MLARGFASSTALLKENERIMGWPVGEGICLKWVKLFDRTMLSTGSVFKLSLDCERPSWELLLRELDPNLGRARRDSDPGTLELLGPVFGPSAGLGAVLLPTVGLIFRDSLGTAFGLETASIKGPALFTLGAAGEPFFASFRPEESLTLSPSSAEVAALLPSSLFHFRENGDVRMAPLGHVGGLVLPSWAGVAGCAEPLDNGPVPPAEQRPPNFGNLDTMADLKEAFFSMRCQRWHGETGNPTHLGGMAAGKVNEEAV